MALLKHGDFEFKNILQSGYTIKEDEPDVIVTKTMGDGSIRKNYGPMPKTTISINIGHLDSATFKEYMSHFSLNEDTYTYFSPNSNGMLTKKFEVVKPEAKINYYGDEIEYDDFVITLNQVGESS